ncbi:ABC transporter permease [Acetatifactor aquisgranensis]|uniref:ABC transporter permease n=1 Tax=Acetatifactor aquisgranensis TaxID=2941233 RepID=UPI00203C1F94|nr:ABC transporter permease [Acetatifactor aquisgranensis]MCI8542622.1 ABC transporter permease [Lachnospiraceae bacterium]
MENNERKTVSRQMLAFEFRKTIGNPYVHIFGVGMPVLMMIIITRAVVGEIADAAIRSGVNTTVFLGIGALIPMATIFMGYGVSNAQELEKGIPQRMELFGIKPGVTICNRILAEAIFMFLAFLIYFAVGYAAVDLEAPELSGALLYAVCILGFSVFLFCFAYGISSLLRKFSLTYCVTMLLYFAMMILGGMMGISYENLPPAVQLVAKLLPVTYINRDFYTVWKGENYNFVPMLQSYLLMGAAAGILMFFTMKRRERKLH